MNELLVSRRGPVVTLILNRPARRNALSRALITALGDTIDELAHEREVRSVILAAEGPVFCAGMDLHETERLTGDPEGETLAVQDAQAFAHVLDRLHRLPVPTIAAMQGDALAGGAGLALACDLVVMAREARIGYPEVLRGLAPAIVLHDLTRQAGLRRVRELVLTGRAISSEEAERWGLINRVVPAASCRDEAWSLATAMLAAAPGALATAKRLLDEETARPPDLQGAAALSASSRLSDEAREGVSAFREKRRPSWFHEVT